MSSIAMRTESAPFRPSASSPPASSIISGTQCPAQKYGSIHSRNVTRGRRATSRVRSATRASRAFDSAMIPSARSDVPVTAASSRMFAKTSSRHDGVNHTTSGFTGSAASARVISFPLGAHTWQSA